MKDTSALNFSIKKALDDLVSDYHHLIDPTAQDALRTMRLETARKVAAKWFYAEEFLTVEIDTDIQTIVVCEAVEETQ